MLSLSYLFELARWKKEAVKGNVSNQGLIKLTKAGVRKPVLRYLAGIDTGTDNIRKKAGAIHQPYKLSTLGVKTKGDPTLQAIDKSLYISKIPGIGYQTRRDPRNDKRLSTYYPVHKNLIDNTGMIDRHEAIESKEFKKNNLDIPTYKGHANRQPLKVELKERNKLNSLYPHLKNHEFSKTELFDERKPHDNEIRSLSNKQIRRKDKKDLHLVNQEVEKLNKQ